MKSQGIRSQAWTRFRGNRLALAGCGFLLGMGAVASLCWSASMRWYAVQDLEQAIRAGPTLKPLASMERVESLRSEPDPREATALERWVYAGFGWMGYDELGRSLLIRTLLGWVVSVAIGAAAALLATGIGVLWGATAGLAGGGVDTTLMRIVDVLYGLPYILLVVLLQIGLRQPLRTWFGEEGQLANVVLLVLAIGSVSWLTMARVIRGQVLVLKGLPFVDAARVAGASGFQILRRHMLPNLVGPITVYATLVVPQAILQESFLSFLGIGIAQPLPSLGRLAADGVQAVNSFVSFWWLITFPSAVLMATLLALNFVGDGLRDALDPKAAMTPVLG